jgi:hypothetical protein
LIERVGVGASPMARCAGSSFLRHPLTHAGSGDIFFHFEGHTLQCASLYVYCESVGFLARLFGWL